MSEYQRVTRDQLRHIADKAARKAVREHSKEMVLHADAFRTMVEDIMSDPKVLGKVAKHAVHLSDLKWQQRFQSMSEAEIYNEQPESKSPSRR